MENWKAVKIPGDDRFDGFYLVSDSGKVMTTTTRAGWPAGLVMKPSLRGGKEGKRYPSVRLIGRIPEGSNRGPQKMVYLHILVAQAWVKKPRHGRALLEVEHINQDKLDCSAGNLMWINHSKNMLRSYQFSTRPRALTASIVLEARGLYSTGEHTYRELAEKYSVNWKTLREAIMGKTWAWLKDEATPCAQYAAHDLAGKRTNGYGVWCR